MSDGYTKLFQSILASTIWQAPLPTRVVWITMLAMADQDGIVSASVPGLARMAGVTLAETETALAAFLAPDKYSRTKDHDGRRIAAVDGGWTVLNYLKYRAKASAEDRREKDAIRQQRKRDSSRSSHAPSRSSHAPSRTVTPPSAPVTPSHAESTKSRQAEAEAEAEAISDPERVRPVEPDPDDTTDPGESATSGSAPWLLVARAYQSRWERDCGSIWSSAARNRSALEDIGRWVEAQAARENRGAQDVTNALLDAFWCDGWARENKWPLGSLAKNPGRYFGGAVPVAAPRKTRTVCGVEYDDTVRGPDGLTDAERAENERIRRAL